MRWVEVDAKASWAREDARYRVFVFAGPSLDVSTTDVAEASVEQALDAARTLAIHDEHLWSLALVALDAGGEEGLVWLSGMDYTRVPETQAQWRRRGEMQSRLLSARSRAGRPLLLPNGLRVLRMFPEWLPGSPLWESFGDDYRLPLDGLGLPPELCDALRRWNDAWSERDVEDPLPDEEAWTAEGLRLHAAVQRVLAGVAEVRREFGP
ncbi:hypothetical protein GCM10009846_29050 [Agrococcus versicolor]|uniref:Uncharacterized protein n=1 Tax=Agrococcus versicolor TaxID=501482 RepID=A0ABN3AYF6_9MICO